MELQSLFDDRATVVHPSSQSIAVLGRSVSTTWSLVEVLLYSKLCCGVATAAAERTAVLLYRSSSPAASHDQRKWDWVTGGSFAVLN